MPRTKEYDRDGVLEQAMQVFWAKGFEGTSMQDLVEATGLNRFGMYQEFGNKEGLFHEALQLYSKVVGDEIFSVLLTPPQDLNSIKKLLQCSVRNYECGEGAKGCMMTNTTIDAPERDRKTVQFIESNYETAEAAFSECLKNAKTRGQVNANLPIKKTAQYLLGILQACAVLRRMDSNQERLKSLVDITIKNLEKS